MKTLQTGTKVLIEATVEFHDTRIDKYAVKTKNGDHVYFVPSDLTVCETAEPIDLNNFAIDITDPVNAELLPGFKEWLNKQPCSLGPPGYFKFWWSRYGMVNGKADCGAAINGVPLTTLPELQKQHPGVFNQSDSEPTPSFKAGQIQIPDDDNCKKEVLKITDDVLNDRISLDEFKKQGLEILNKYHPIPAQPTVESELLEIVEGVESCRYSTELAVEKILAWHQKYTRLSSELRNLLEDVVNELELSEGMIEKHGPLGTEPSKLVRLVLDQKDQQIKALKAGMIDIKHSGRVEVSVPSDEEIENAIDQYGFQIPYDGSNKFYNDDKIKHFKAGVDWFRHFMTRKEAK